MSGKLSPVTYYVNQSIASEASGRPALNVTGYIVTDGAIGNLGASDLVNFNLLVNNGTSSYDLNESTPSLQWNFSGVSATKARLSYNFSIGGSFEFVSLNFPEYLWCFGCGTPDNPGGAGNDVIAYLTYTGVGVVAGFDHLSGTHVIGTAAMLPTGGCLHSNPPGAAGCFAFLGGSSGAWFDPASSSGYTYQMTGSSLFTSIQDLPLGFQDPFIVTSPGCTIPGTYDPGQRVDFAALCGGGVSTFTITGINPSFDPTNPEAFPIQIAFNTRTADFIAEPLGPVSTPEPSSVVLLSFGVGAFGLIARCRRAGLLRYS